MAYKNYVVFSIILILFTSNRLFSQTCTVNAGIPYSVCQTDLNGFTLSGGANSPSGDPVPITWSLISEPAGSSVAITNPSNALTTVTNVTEIGTYEFQIAGVCPDGSGTAIDMVTYTVSPPIISEIIEDTVVVCNLDTIPIANYDPAVDYTVIRHSTGGMVAYLSGSEVIVGVNDNYFYPGDDDSYLELVMENGSCIVVDTLEFYGCQQNLANAGADVTVCGNTWTKTMSVLKNVISDDPTLQSYVGICGIQTWTQLSGPNTATITYPPVIPGYFITTTDWSNLITGTYEFELEYDYNFPCSETYKDTVTFYVAAPNSCQDIGGLEYYKICDEADSLYIDLVNDFGLDTSALSPLDTIFWDFIGSGCSKFPTVPLNTTFFAIHRDDVCNSCNVQITLECASGCYSILELIVGKLDTEIKNKEQTICVSDQNPIKIATFNTAEIVHNCVGGAAYRNTTIFSSPDHPSGIQHSPSLLFGVGTHIFKTQYETLTSYPYNVVGSCEISGLSTVTIYPILPVANAGTDAILPCSIDTITLSGNDPNIPLNYDVHGTWSQILGPAATIADPTVTNPFISNLLFNQVYAFEYRIGNALCGITKDIVYVYTANTPPVANAGPDLSPCDIGCLSLEGVSGAGKGEWAVSPSGPTIQDVNDPKSEVCNLTAGTSYTFIWTIQNGCGVDVDSVTVTTPTSPGFIADAGPDFCAKFNAGNTIQLNGTPLPSGTTGLWTEIGNKYWGVGRVTLDDVTDPQTGGTETGSFGSTIFQWEVTDPNCGVSRDTVIVTKYLKETNGPISLSFCSPGTYEIDWLSKIGGSQLGRFLDTSNYTGPSGVTFSTDGSPVSINFPSSGQYNFIIRDGCADCAPMTDMIITINDYTEPFSDGGPDQVICNNYSWNMMGNAPANGGHWLSLNASDLITISDPTDPLTSVTATSSGVYYFEWFAYPEDTISINCGSYDTVAIKIVGDDQNLGEDLSICGDQVIGISGAYYPDGTMTWSSSGPTSLNLVTIGNDNFVNVSGFTSDGEYWLIYEVTVPGCPTVIDSVKILNDCCQYYIDEAIDICTLLDDGAGGFDATHPMATLDCDNGGVANITECESGEDPSEPSDDCTAAIDEEIDICALLDDGAGGYDATHPMATLDCDNGGVANITECESGEDPSEPSDDCTTAMEEEIDICAILDMGANLFDSGHPLATLDCDNGGIDNIDECIEGNDPSEPSDDVIFPIELVEFNGTEELCDIYLDWKTLSETDFSHFDLQRSTNGQDFEIIYTTRGKGIYGQGSTYQYVDKRSNNRKNYYRINHVDLDGTQNYSPTILVENNCITDKISTNVFPNPAFGQITFQIVYNSNTLKNGELRILDVLGRIVITNKIELHQGLKEVSVNINELPSGIYFISLTGNNWRTKTIKFVVLEN